MKSSGKFLLLICFALIFAAQHAAAATVLSVSADEIKQIMLEKAYSVEQAKLKADAAGQTVMQSKGIFDTNFSAGVSHQIDDSAKPSPIFGDRIDTTRWEVAANRRFATGTQAGIGFRSERLKYHDALAINGNPVFPSEAIYEPIIAFTVSQPVMKNAGGYLDRRTVKSAELGSLKTELSVQREIESLVYGALADYWTLALVRGQIVTRQKLVDFAKQFLATTVEERKLGTAEETDLLAAKANVLMREDELLAYKEVERVWHEKLRVDLGVGPEIEIKNAEAKPPLIKLTGSGDDRVGAALENRRDYQASKKELELRDVELAMAKNQRWPSLDLYSTLELNEIKNGYTSAVSSMNDPNWIVGMRFSVPIENRAARAGKKIADIQKASAVVALKDLENRITNSVVRNFEEVASRRRIVEQSAEALNLQVSKLKQEMDKYSMGRSSSDLIVRYQDDVVNAERANLEAWLAYQESVLDLALSEGKLVEYKTADEASIE